MNPEPELYYSRGVIKLILDNVVLYVFKETGLAPATLYNDNDHYLYNQVLGEVIPEPLGRLLLSLSKLPAIEETA